jgi:hypothetical protein
MFLDFDRFKLINDSLGHNAGDEFLIQVSRRIQDQPAPGRRGGPARRRRVRRSGAAPEARSALRPWLAERLMECSASPSMSP